METAYENWVSGDYTLPGEFELKMFKAYQCASGHNRLRLETAFPGWFKPSKGNLFPDLNPIEYHLNALQMFCKEHTNSLEDLKNLETAATQWLEHIRLDIQQQQEHMKDIKLRDDYLEHIHQAIDLANKLGLSKDYQILSPLERDIPF